MMTHKTIWISRMVLLLVLVLFLVVTGSFSFRPSLVYAAPIKVVLSGESGEVLERSSPAVADFNGDGYKEIVVGGSLGTLSVISYNGASWSEVWHRQTADDLVGAPAGCGNGKSNVQSAPVIADLDNDGDLEIVVSVGGMPSDKRNGGVLVYQYTGGPPSWSFSRASGWPQPKTDGGNVDGSDADGCWDGFWASPAVGDLDGDGDLEITVGSFDRRIHAWHHDGTEMDGWPVYRQTEEGVDCLVRGGNWSSPAMGDIDGDGLPEVVIGTESPPWNCPRNWDDIANNIDHGTVWAINGDSSNVPGWPVITQNWIQSSPALGDLDGDGDLEVIVASGDSQAGGNGKLVYAWHDNGMAVANWPRSTAQDVRGAPALGDLDGDGALDVVVGCGTEATNCDKVYAWKGNGNNVAGFPATVSGVQSFPWAPVLADYDGDGSVEILFVSKWGNRVLESNGQVDAGASFDTDSLTGMGSPVVDDINDDDDLDVVIAGPSDFVSAPVGSAVYIWLSTGGTTSSETPWPMFHRTVDRQGAYPVPPRLVFQDEVRVFHTYGSGNTETKTVYVSNDGSGSFDWAITHAITRLQTLPALGTVTTTVPTQFVITTTDLITGWHTLGTVTVTGTVGGEAVLGSPAASSLILYVGNPARVYMPVVFRNY